MVGRRRTPGTPQGARKGANPVACPPRAGWAFFGSLLHVMKWQTAGVHLGRREAVGAVRRGLRRRPRGRPREAANSRVEATTSDWAGRKKG